MKVAICRLPIDTRSARSDPEALPDASRVQLGDELLFYASNAKWASVLAHARRSHLPMQEHPATIKPDNLYLVTQIGRLFEQAHPDVPVLFNKGRYLVVELDPQRARTFEEGEGLCYALRPLKGNMVVFDMRAPITGRAARIDWVQALVDRISRATLEASLTHLAAFPTRHSTSTHYVNAAEWAREQLQAMGYSTKLEPIALRSGTSVNVIAEKLGRSPGPRDLVCVVAHLDSINLDNGPMARAPGADDNGSGSAGLLEIARALKDHHGTHDLRFILFGGEEQGLFGSRQHVASLTASERARIQAVVNMDMIGTLNTTSPTVLIEGASVSQAVIDGLAEAAGAYTQLTVQTSLSPFNSDHVPFIDAGLSAVLTIEGTDSANSHVHTADDTLDHIHYDLALDILRMNVAFVARAVGQQSEVVAPVHTVEPQGGALMSMQNPQAQSDITLTIKAGSNLAEVLRGLPFHYSGCYQYNGGGALREGLFVDKRSGLSYAAIKNPLYKLDEPIYIDSPEDHSASSRLNEQARFTLYVDIDGTDPLGVVSGSVALGALVPGSPSQHFIGRVTSNTATNEGRQLIVEDFNFRWPDSSDMIRRLEIRLTGSALITSAAEVTFWDPAQNRSYGPYLAQQESTHFREVEVDVDREINAVDVEPCSTHVHPDRPSDLPEEELTLESAFAKAGIRVTRSPGSGTAISSGAGINRRWNYSELHDSMELHWDAFGNRPQWKMWIFLAELADTDSLGGVMFDGDIDEPGGVDRQGTALFTRCPYFHTEQGGYIQANPPTAEAVKRELFFNLIHETGHAFNLAHSFQKQLSSGPGEGAWMPPVWMPLTNNNQALSWMNYPDSATPGGGAGANATWFYQRFRFRFDASELLFLRHAPESYVQMGNAAWFQNHGRVSRISLDRRLELVVRNRKDIVELGEPVLLELRLRNRSDQAVMVHHNLDPSDGLVEVAVTNPAGERRPFLPIDHTRTNLLPQQLGPGQATYHPLDLTMGQFGFPFKEPGAYRIEVSYTNIDGRTAAAVMQLYVRPPASFDDRPVVNELFNARIGRALYVDGTRVMEDVNDKLDWVRDRLGAQHPISYHLTTVRYKPMATPSKVVEPGSDQVRAYDPEPDRVVTELEPVIEQTEAAADTMGHMWYRNVVDTYTQTCVEVHQQTKARHAQEKLLGLFKERNVIPSVVEAVEKRMDELR